MAIIFSLSLCLSACANGNYENEEFIDKEISLESTETSEASGNFAESEQTENDCSIIMGDLTISLNESKQDIFSKLDKAGINYSEFIISDSENTKYDSYYDVEVEVGFQMYFLKDECVRLRLMSCSDSLDDLVELPQTSRGLQPYSTYSQMVEKYGDSYETHSYAGKEVYTIYRYSFDKCICEFGIPGENSDVIYNMDIYISNQYPIYEYGEEIEEKETEKVFQSWQEAYLDVLYHLLDNLAPQYEPNGTDLRLDDYDSTDIRIYLGLHDFDNDGMEELIAGDTLGIAVFTYKEGRVEKIADLYDPNSMWCVDGFYFKDNSISLDSDGAGGADYVNFGYLDNEYVLGIYNELCPDYGVIINGHEGTLEEMNRIYSTDWRDRESNIESDLKEWISLVKENQEWYLIYQSGEKVLLNSEFDFDSILW
jgi:hypothetical protein